ncbi:hypothetical protein K501DRAFT_269462 [Backusella circina FSU 941]|nr:hypothetical protein K501DRAFT_269462 [Backusella circina FSU 941]
MFFSLSNNLFNFGLDVGKTYSSCKAESCILKKNNPSTLYFCYVVMFVICINDFSSTSFFCIFLGSVAGTDCKLLVLVDHLRVCNFTEVFEGILRKTYNIYGTDNSKNDYMFKFRASITSDAFTRNFKRAQRLFWLAICSKRKKIRRFTKTRITRRATDDHYIRSKFGLTKNRVATQSTSLVLIGSGTEVSGTDCPQYKLNGMFCFVEGIWREYTEGFAGFPPVEKLEEGYGTRWRKNASKSRRIAAENNSNIMGSQAKLKLAAENLEKYRVKKGITLDKLMKESIFEVIIFVKIRVTRYHINYPVPIIIKIKDSFHDIKVSTIVTRRLMLNIEYIIKRG